jgi:hypothetical protein
VSYKKAALNEYDFIVGIPEANLGNGIGQYSLQKELKMALLLRPARYGARYGGGHVPGERVDPEVGDDEVVRAD